MTEVENNQAQIKILVFVCLEKDNINIKYLGLSCLYSSEKVNMLKHATFMSETM